MGKLGSKDTHRNRKPKIESFTLFKTKLFQLSSYNNVLTQKSTSKVHRQSGISVQGQLLVLENQRLLEKQFTCTGSLLLNGSVNLVGTQGPQTY